MRVLSKVLTGSMIAGAALLVAACGHSDDATVNNTADVGSDTMMDGTTNDVTAIDGANGSDTNMAMDSNMSTDTNMTGGNMSTDTNASGDAGTTNGM